MKVDVYQSRLKDTKFISVPTGTDMAKLSLPDTIDKNLLDLKPFKMGMEMRPSQPRIAMDQEEIIKDIERQGYAIHGSIIETTIHTAKGGGSDTGG